MSTLPRREQLRSRGEYCVAEDGKVYVSMNALQQYRTNIGGVAKTTTGSLMDSGANGGMAGDDVLITAYHDHDHAQVMGIAGNSLDGLRIVTAAGFIESTDGPVIGIFHQYAHHGKGKSIHSIPQMQGFDVHIDCTSKKKNGMHYSQWMDYSTTYSQWFSLHGYAPPYAGRV